MKENVLRDNATSLFTSNSYGDYTYYAQRLYALQYDKLASIFQYNYSFEDEGNSDVIYLFNALQNAGFEQVNSIESRDDIRLSESVSLSDNCPCRYGENYHFFWNREKQIYVFIEYRAVSCVYELQNVESKKWCESFLNNFKNFCKIFHPKKSKIKCISCDDSHYYLKGMDIKPVENMDIDLLYNDDFAVVDENVRSFMKNDKNGLVILHGEQGTGKTSYIRHLISITDKHFVYLPLDMASHLSDPRMITFICDKLADAVIVIEDCEQLLVDRSDSYNCVNTGLVNILNMADGLLGDSLNLKFICTFNSDVRKIDKALLRKGRLVDKYEFGKLSKEKTAALMNKQYHLNGDYEPMTLAEIFNYNIENHGQNRTRKSVGFN
ncbi:MAG: ATP-binding protein [Bacteroidales bacterium]|nr:ATP-binding protein [Bacteroidales bacterium]